MIQMLEKQERVINDEFTEISSQLETIEQQTVGQVAENSQSDQMEALFHQNEEILRRA